MEKKATVKATDDEMEFEFKASPFGEMNITYCYKSSSGDYSLSVNDKTVEVLRNLFRAKALVELSNDCVEEAYKSLRIWKKLNELFEEETEE